MFVAVLLIAALGLGDFSSGVRDAIVEKIRDDLAETPATEPLEGTVTWRGDGHFFIQDGLSALKVVHDVGPLPAVGDRVSVTGYPSLEGGRVVLVAKSWFVSGTAPLPDCTPVESDDLVYGGIHGVDGRRVEVVGRAFDLTERGFAIDVKGVPVTVNVAPLPDFVENCAHLRPLVRVKGVVEQLLDQSVLFGSDPYVLGVKMSVNGPGDIALVEDATYLMNLHRDLFRNITVIVAVVLLIGAAVFAVIIVRQRARAFKTATLMAERKRMADDIHDTIEQHLVGAGMLLQLNRNKEAREILLRAKAELRDIIWGLKNDDMMRLSPEEMLKKVSENETKKGLFRVSTKITGLPKEMTAQEKRDLSLIVRESIGNAVKHGNAKKIAITCDKNGEKGWTLRISNDGIPFDEASVHGVTEGHFGLAGMRERAKRLGAAMEIYVKNGWTVIKISKQ